MLKIIGVNVVLSGDNAVVIALAARSLPETQRRQAILAQVRERAAEQRQEMADDFKRRHAAKHQPQ